MSESITGSGHDAIGDAAQKVADGFQQAVDQIQSAACEGIQELRRVIRAQPIAAVLVVFVLGYVVGCLRR